MVKASRDENTRIKHVYTDSNYVKRLFYNLRPSRMPTIKKLVLMIVLGSLFSLFIIENSHLRSSPAVPIKTIRISTIYFITPTYKRADQVAQLTRLAQTLNLVPNLYWILIEDELEKSPFIADMLARKGIRAVYMCDDTNVARNLGDLRMKCVRWVLKNGDDNGVIYFGDDDNTYDTELFEEMRTINKVGMWPVGQIYGSGISSPIISEGKCIGFYDPFLKRKFCVDMAGFAVNVKFLKERPNATMTNEKWIQEETFLKSLAPFEPYEIEPKAKNCQKVLVWHTKTIRKPWIRNINEGYITPKGLDYMNNTNLIKLMDLM